MSDQEIKTFAQNAKKLMEQGRFQVAGDVVPIRPPPSQSKPSEAQQEGMKSIDKMFDIMRKPPR